MIDNTDLVFRRMVNWLLRKTANSAVRRVGLLPFSAGTEIGLDRNDNQDRVAVGRGFDNLGRPYLLAVLCDGMGGMKDGAVCAATALAGFLDTVFKGLDNSRDSQQLLLQAAVEANNRVFEKYKGNGGATLSAVLIDGRKDVHWVNVGDSRIYLFEKNTLTQLTRDDTMAEYVGHHHPNMPGGTNLLQFIGIGKDIEPHLGRIHGEPSTQLLLTSDGIHFIQKEILEKIAVNSSEPAICIRRLTELSKWCGGHDNGSAILLLPFASYEIISKDPYVYEVWDPFGEIQLIQVGGARESLHSRPVPDDVNPQVIPSGSQAKKDSGNRSTALPSKKRRSGKKKTNDIATGSGKQKKKQKGPLPQLKIDFPTKS